MPGHATHWQHVVGDGLVYAGPCIVYTIILWPHADTQYVDIYDGRDPTSGTKFCRLEISDLNSLPVSLAPGILFSRGIYVDAQHAEDETTVTFMPI